MGNTAKTADLAGLKSIEFQIEDLNAQLVTVQTHFSRLDTIELELRALAERMTGDEFAKLFENKAGTPVDNEALAGAVASRVAQQMPKIEGLAVDRRAVVGGEDRRSDGRGSAGRSRTPARSPNWLPI